MSATFYNECIYQHCNVYMAAHAHYINCLTMYMQNIVLMYCLDIFNWYTASQFINNCTCLYYYRNKNTHRSYFVCMYNVWCLSFTVDSVNNLGNTIFGNFSKQYIYSIAAPNIDANIIVCTLHTRQLLTFANQFQSVFLYRRIAKIHCSCV